MKIVEHKKKGGGSQGVDFLSTAEVRQHIPSPTHPVLIAINSSYVEASHFLRLHVWRLEKTRVLSFALLLEFILVLFFRALRQHGSLFVLNLCLHWADCWDNLQPGLSELMWPGSICVRPCFAFSSIYFLCKPCRAGCSCYTYTKSAPRDSVPALARNIFNYFNLLKFSALLWEMTNPHTAHRLTVL